MTSTHGPPFSFFRILHSRGSGERKGREEIHEGIVCLSAQTGFKIFTYVQSPLAQPRVFAMMTS